MYCLINSYLKNKTRGDSTGYALQKQKLVLYLHSLCNKYGHVYVYLLSHGNVNLLVYMHRKKSFWIRKSYLIEMLKKLSMLIMIRRHYWATVRSSPINGCDTPFPFKNFLSTTVFFTSFKTSEYGISLYAVYTPI